MEDIHNYIIAPIKLKWGGKNKYHFVNLGYKFTKISDEFYVTDPRHLMRESSVRVRVLCPDCKKVRVVDYKGLVRSGNTRCFECATKKDITGNRFGRLVALSPTEQPRHISKTNTKSYWLFLCDCGRTKKIVRHDVEAGKTTSCGCLAKELVGERHHSWKEGTDRRRYRPDKKVKKWRMSVFRRDNFCCVVCGSTMEIRAHHIANFHWAKHVRYDLDNGVTLCLVCHEEFHSIYGYKNNIDIQFEEYMDNYMSGKRSITKGRSGERQAAKAIREQFDINVYRGKQYQGGPESPDLRGLSEYGLHCEVKRDEQTVTKRLSQDLAGEAAIGTYKGNRVIVLPLSSITTKANITKMKQIKLVKPVISAIEQAERDCGNSCAFVLSRRNYDEWYVFVREQNYNVFFDLIVKLPKIKNEHTK